MGAHNHYFTVYLNIADTYLRAHLTISSVGVIEVIEVLTASGYNLCLWDTQREFNNHLKGRWLVDGVKTFLSEVYNFNMRRAITRSTPYLEGEEIFKKFLTDHNWSDV